MRAVVEAACVEKAEGDGHGTVNSVPSSAHVQLGGMVLQNCCPATLQAACMTTGLSKNETCAAMMRAIDAVYAAHMLPAAQPASAPAKAGKASAKAGSRARAGHADAVALQPPQVGNWRSSC